MKTHAKDYLFEISNNPATEYWLRLLINVTIACNGNIDETRIEEIYEAFKSQRQGDLPSIQAKNDGEEIQLELKSLMHKSGVNALKTDQEILFSSAITILYGLNGSGKSSYFRILNEIAGGNVQKTIGPNIFVDAPLSIDVLLKYAVNKKESVISWNGKSRAIGELTFCRVFDSSYLQGLLEQHPMAETLVFPIVPVFISYNVMVKREAATALLHRADTFNGRGKSGRADESLVMSMLPGGRLSGSSRRSG